MSDHSPDKPIDRYSGNATCPNCFAYSQHVPIAIYTKSNTGRFSEFNAIGVRACVACNRLTIWHGTQQIFPIASTTAPPPNPDMPDDVRQDYEEARSIAELSPRGAGALLRLALQRLLQQLAGHKGNIDGLIHELESKGMSRMVANMNHSIRVIGNNAVHPLELDLNEQPGMVAASFQLLNYIVEDQITRPRLASEMMAKLPEGARDAIQARRERDAKKCGESGA